MTIKSLFDNTTSTLATRIELKQGIEQGINNPIHFINKCIHIQHPNQGPILFNLYLYQQENIRKYNEFEKVIVSSPRQTGNSTLTIAYILWYALFHTNKTILIASDSTTNTQHLMSMIRFAYNRLPNWMPFKSPMVKNVTDNIVFENGCKIHSMKATEDFGRGYAPSLVYLDNLAFVSLSIQQPMWISISPMLTSPCKCIITSTPNGNTDVFAKLWKGAMLGENGFHPTDTTRTREWQEQKTLV
jgi:hypothetical protein